MPAAAGVLLAVLAGAAPAGAAPGVHAGLYLTGAGFGHGVGMSQYGAAGYALHGVELPADPAATITRARRSGTSVPNRIVTVLLQAHGSAVFSGAIDDQGIAAQKLNPAANYSVVAAGRASCEADLRGRNGRHLQPAAAGRRPRAGEADRPRHVPRLASSSARRAAAA